MTKLIGLAGRAGAGKSTAAKYLIEQKGYVRLPFAAPLKKMLLALGLNERETDGDLKEMPCDILLGQTPRRALQFLGTEWGRNLIHPDLWIELWRREAARLLNEGHSVVADDCRFQNEARALQRLGGKIILIRTENPHESVFSDHASERQEIEPDARVLNDLISLASLSARIDGALEQTGVLG